MRRNAGRTGRPATGDEGVGAPSEILHSGWPRLGQTARVGLEIRYEEGLFHLTTSPPHTTEDRSDTVESSLMAVTRLLAWGCQGTDVTAAMDTVAPDWRRTHRAERAELRARVAEYERQNIQFADRIGRPANQDYSWFDKKVDEWKNDDGTRLVVLELSDLGRQMVHWVRVDRQDIVQEILNEMEEAMLDGGVESTIARGMGLELLDGLRAELMEFMDQDADGAKKTDDSIRLMMGDETKQLWIPMRSGMA